jgi:hypothetical protein
MSRKKKTKEGEPNEHAKTLIPIEHVHNLAKGDKLEGKLEGDQICKCGVGFLNSPKPTKRQNG